MLSISEKVTAVALELLEVMHSPPNQLEGVVLWVAKIQSLHTRYETLRKMENRQKNKS